MNYSRIFIVSLLLLSWVTAMAHPDKAKKPRGPQIERASAADSQVAISICLASGDITIHGWDRSLVRARSTAGEIEFKRGGAIRDSDPAKEITVLSGKMRSGFGSCVSGGDFELDVPRGATVRLQTRDGDIRVTDVASVYANTQGGDVDLHGVQRSVDASTIGGRIALRNSRGSLKLHSIGGEIEVHDAQPAGADDICEADSVGGDVTLDQTGYAKLRAGTIDGAVNVSGPLTHGGRYELKTISGDLNLALPETSSFRLEGRISRSAELVSDFPLKSDLQTSGRSSGRGGSRISTDGDLAKGSGYAFQHLSVVFGTGDALIIVSSFSGAIHLRKK